jgi:hypothetical protein
MGYRLRLFTIVVALLALIPLSAASAEPDLTGALRNGNALRYGLSIAHDGSRIPSASYFNDDRNLYLLRFTNGGWNEQLVHTTGIVRSYFNFTSLVYVFDQPHIIFYDSAQNNLKHSWHNGVWQTETIDAGSSVGSYLSAIHCGEGNLCVAYYDATSMSLKFAKGTMGSWTITTLDSGTNQVGQFTSIALTTEGRPLVAYYDATLELPKVAENTGNGTWTIETLPAVGGYGRWTSIAQGSDGTTHLSAGSYFDRYNNSANGYTYYASKPLGGAWSATQLPFLYTGTWTSLLLDSSNKPVICSGKYQNSIFGQDAAVSYLYRDANNDWQGVPLAPNYTLNSYTHIRCLLDYWNDPVVGYYFTNGQSQFSGIYLHSAVDADNDQLPDLRDPAPADTDADNDGLGDGYELLINGTDHTIADSDGDMVDDLNDALPLDPYNNNLLADANCDQGTVTAWKLLRTPFDLQKESVVVAEGQRSLLIKGGGTLNGVAQRNLATSQTTRYRLQLWYKRSAGTIRVSLGWGYDLDLENAALVDNSSSAWVSYARDITTPDSPGDLRLLIETNGEALIDHVQLYESPLGATPLPQSTVRPSATPTFTPTPVSTHTPSATPTFTPTATPTTTQTPLPTGTQTPAPPASPTAGPSEPGKRVIAVSVKNPRRSTTSRVHATIFIDGAVDTPLVNRSLSLSCARKRVATKRSDALGRATYAVARRAKSLRCVVSAGKLRSKTFKVPQRTRR